MIFKPLCDKGVQIQPKPVQKWYRQVDHNSKLALVAVFTIADQLFLFLYFGAETAEFVRKRRRTVNCPIIPTGLPLTVEVTVCSFARKRACMRIVTLEEHISFPQMTQLIPKEALGNFGQSPMMQKIAPKLADITNERLASMDDTGITLQVLSVDGVGANLLSTEAGPAFATRYNTLIAKKIATHPDRFSAFAHLPMTAPLAAADELERAVKEHGFRGAMIRGLTNDQFLDHPKFAPIFERAMKLG